MIGCQLAAPYHSGHFTDADAALRPGGADLTRRALHYAGFAAGQTIVDLGCGEAAGTELLRRTGCLAIGVDLSMRALASAASHFAAEPTRAAHFAVEPAGAAHFATEPAGAAHFAAEPAGASRRTVAALLAAPPLSLPSLVAANAAQLPFADQSLDGMLAECSLSLTGFAHAALAECQRVLRPGGRLAITDIFARASDTACPALPEGCLASATEKDDIVARLIDAGFEIERWEDHSALLKTFIARLIFQSGSLDSLWGGHASGAPAASLSDRLRRSRPGYFLLIASKSEKEPRP